MIDGISNRPPYFHQSKQGFHQHKCGCGGVKDMIIYEQQPVDDSVNMGKTRWGKHWFMDFFRQFHKIMENQFVRSEMWLLSPCFFCRCYLSRQVAQIFAMDPAWESMRAWKSANINLKDDPNVAVFLRTCGDG